MQFAFICFGFLGFFYFTFWGFNFISLTHQHFFHHTHQYVFHFSISSFHSNIFCCLVVLLYSLWLITRIVFLLQYLLSIPKTFYPKPSLFRPKMAPLCFYYNTGFTVFHTDIRPYSLHIWGCPIRVCWWLWFPFDLGSRIGDSFIICFNDF